jgi:biopolymer transport protein ExbB/TolQ
LISLKIKISNNLCFRENFNEKEEIVLAMKDKTGKKKKGGKSDFDAAVKGNEEIRAMKFHKMTFEELEQEFETNINDSELSLKLNLNFIFREGTKSRSSFEKVRTSW